MFAQFIYRIKYTIVQKAPILMLVDHCMISASVNTRQWDLLFEKLCYAWVEYALNKQ